MNRSYKIVRPAGRDEYIWYVQFEGSADWLVMDCGDGDWAREIADIVGVEVER